MPGWLRSSILAAALAATAAAPSRRDLQEAERSRTAQLAAQREATERVRQAQVEERVLADQRVAAAARLRGIETDAQAHAEEVAALSGRQAEAERRLAERAAAMAPLLPLAQRLSLFPAETLLAVPASPSETLRGLAVLRGLVQELERQSALLRADQQAAQSAARDVALALPKLQAAQSAQAAEAAALDRQIDAARTGRLRAEDAATEAARRAASDAARADSLRGALAAIDAARERADRQAQEDAARAARQKQDAAAAEARTRQEALARPAGPGVEPRGQVLPPVAGTVVRGWGERTDAGPASGVSYRAAPLARVVAPCGGRVAFAGPFRSFGLLAIVDCGGGYHFVLAGLDRLDVQAGTAVQAGEPVGVMPGWDPAKPGNRPALYVELRRDGQAVNPAPFLRARG